jgi:hypothetical protein
VNKALGSETEDAAGRGSKAMGALGVTKGLAIGLAGAGVASLAGAAKVGWDEFKQGQAVAAQTAAVLKSTGGAANVTADRSREPRRRAPPQIRRGRRGDPERREPPPHLHRHSERGRQGKRHFQSDHENDARYVVALGQDTKSSAIQLGKALNDPIKGVTALQRVGVSFTAGSASNQGDGGRRQHDGRAEADPRRAQQGIRRQRGGRRKDAPGATLVFKETFSNVAGEAVGAVVPALTGSSRAIIDHLPAIENFVGGIANRLMPMFRAWWGYIQADSCRSSTTSGRSSPRP